MKTITGDIKCNVTVCGVFIDSGIPRLEIKIYIKKKKNQSNLILTISFVLRALIDIVLTAFKVCFKV